MKLCIDFSCALYEPVAVEPLARAVAFSISWQTSVQHEPVAVANCK